MTPAAANASVIPNASAEQLPTALAKVTADSSTVTEKLTFKSPGLPWSELASRLSVAAPTLPQPAAPHELGQGAVAVTEKVAPPLGWFAGTEQSSPRGS
jgi:hypothetical protein